MNVSKNNPGFHYSQGNSGLTLFGLLLSIAGVVLLWRQGHSVTTWFVIGGAALLIVLPVLCRWEVSVIPTERRLLLRRGWRRTAVDLGLTPARELVVMESNTEPGLHFPKIVLADGRAWVLPSEVSSRHEQLAQALKLCCPGLVVRNSTLLQEM